jgi:beta-glucanase (GH16 family)
MKKTILFLLFFVFLMCETYSANLIGVTSPAYCSNIQGNTIITISAPNFTQVTVYCWKQGDGFGTNTVVGRVTLDASGVGSINFPADVYPHGPITLRISGTSATNSDNCYLQLYNTSGVSWNEGMPAAPAAADGLNLVFADDFNKTDLSIGSDGNLTATYYDHKPPYGSQDFSSIPFTSFNQTNNPFSQVDSYLRIRASSKLNSTGLISSTKSNKTGIKAKAPCYFECRFIGPNAPGSWPAFWLLSLKDGGEQQCDELDIIEAYGGEGAGKPNSGPVYAATPHAWAQPGAPTQIADDFYRTKAFVNMYNFGIPSTWYEASHIYGCKVGLDYTIYYCDNIEVGRHETLPLSKIKPFYFMINLGTGGGWPVDLSRYDGTIDMYVDYVRVYALAPTGLALDKESEINVNIYPNPVTSETAIHLSSPNLEDISVNICNVLGQSVLSYHTYEQGEIKIPINMSGLSNGTYLAKIQVGNSQFTKTIIK